MVDIKICKEKMAILDLRFPPSAKKWKQLVLELTRKYNPDLCETHECRAEHEIKMSQIMRAHLFWKNQENSDACYKIISEAVGNFLHALAPFGPKIDVAGLNDIQKQVLAEVAEQHGWS
jgi:hypothetical protein